MAYNRVNWTNSADTPLNAGNLNNMDLGIKKLDDQVSELETKTTMLYSNNLSLHNFTGNTLMLNSKGFETTDNYTVVDNPTEFSTINDWLKISTASKSGVYGTLSKIVDLWGDGRQLLIKLRVKASKSGVKIYPARRLNGNNGTYIDSFCVVSSNLTTINTMSHWVLPDTNWHDLWLIIKGNTSDGYELNEVGVFIQSPDNTATTVYVQQFDVFFNNDTAECTGATEEQLKQIQSNTNAIAKLEAETTADIKNIKTALNNGFAGKVISVIGDSISTFAGYIPVADGYNLEHRARYPQDDLLTDVNKTWWKMLIDNLGAKLGINDSWAGTTVSNTSTANEGDSGPDACMASMTRIKNLGSNGTPDLILFYGGTNDIGQGVELGSFEGNVDFMVDDTTTWTTFADAYAEAIKRLQFYYPFTQIVVLLPTYTESYYSRDSLDKYNKVIMQICDYFGVPYIDLRKCGINLYNHNLDEYSYSRTLGDGIHPNEAGMALIERYVRRNLLSMCELEVGENVVYSVTNHLTNATNGNKSVGVSAKRYYLGFIEPVEGYELSYISVVMNGEDVTSQCVTNNGSSEIINITNITGDIVITATAISTQRISANEHIQEIPSDATAETNLYSVIEPQDSYYNSSGNWITETPVVPSIVIPVLPGDNLVANSFGEGSWDGIDKLGIRVTYLLDNEVVTSVAPEDVYAEYIEKGYITVPEGVNTVCVPWWSKSDDNILYLLTL